MALHAVDHPPFFMHDNHGNLVGLDVDLAKMIASELGVQVEFLRTATSFEGVVDQVMRQEADMAISKISLTLNRAKRVLYTDPYFVFRQALLINRILLEQYPTGISVAHLAERSDIKIAVLEGTSYAQFAERLFPKASLMRAQDWHAEITPAVAEGLVLAAFRDELEVIRALRTIPQGTLKMVAVVLSDREDPLMMVLPPQSHGLRLWLNLFLRAKSVRFNLDYLKQHYRDYL
ncbi:MAG: substrate-binding periplasmic protein [Holosporales bacterium]